ncbi:RagB/SusD family nutrient uptake outer membrane protein [Porphyromonas pogonae]|uniref:RagB/SusD family nutrient uptake outer membrane protein n=1 Tax=Porphyromonas pogonae TaxID=867595 RepID=UPI002E7743B5|nr:RagB/SusD family nutrient uptake outer membrane protein [Porphyromonas pogonae]
MTDPKAIYSVQTAYEALASAYAKFPKNHFELSLMSDDFVPLYLSRRDFTALNVYYWLDKNISLLSDDLWFSYYETIKDINAVMVRQEELRKNLNSEEVLQLDYLMGEAKTLKAYCYLELLQFYATRFNDKKSDEGIILKNNVFMEVLPRATKQESSSEIISLLQSARSLFVSGAKAPMFHKADPIFTNYNTTSVLLAKLALYREDYAEALKYVEEYLNKSPFTIDDIPLDVNKWGKASSGSGVFATALSGEFYQKMYSEKKEWDQDCYMLDKSVTFESSDLRAKVYAHAFESSDITSSGSKESILLLGKYNTVNHNKDEVSYAYQIRKSETIFIKAECLARLGKNTEAIKVINDYLQLVHASSIDSSLSGEKLVNAILDQKHKEFVGENVRFFDLKRCKIKIEKYDINGHHLGKYIEPDNFRWTFPIPRDEYKVNNKIKQNPGWPTIGTED